MSERPLAVFVSCGSADTQAQESFITAVEEQLRSHGCEPSTVGRSRFTGRQPVEFARNLIGGCDGVIVIAFERTRIIQGLERPDSAEPKKLRNESHPTVWNQLEAAMAYAQRVPIMTLVQSGLKRQGMLSDRLEWVAIETDLAPSFLKTEKFQQVFREWLSLVQKKRDAPEGVISDPTNLKIGDLIPLISQLAPKQFLGLLVAIAGVLSLIVSVSFTAGQLYGSRQNASSTMKLVSEVTLLSRNQPACFHLCPYTGGRHALEFRKYDLRALEIIRHIDQRQPVRRAEVINFISDEPVSKIFV
jgi:hypothetical protein